jgi:hypothetical protein
MSSLLSEQLSSFSETDYAVRAVRGLLGVLPFVPDWRHPGSLPQAAARLDPALAERVAARADALSREPAVQAALNSFELLDKGDKGIAIFSGLKAGYQGLKGQEGALEVDPQQAADAGLKAAGIAYATWKLFPGTTQEKAQALLASESGRSLLAFYVAVDVVLPFADNVAAGGVAGMTGIIEKYSAENAARLAPIAGQEVAEAAGMLAALSGTISGLVGQAATFAQPLSAWAQEKLPGMLGTADKITGVVATAVDTLATYRYLGAALVAEVLLQRALVEVRAEVAEEQAAEARRLAEEEARRQAEEAERRRKEDEAEAARKKLAEEEAERQRQAEAERRKKVEEEARQRVEEEQRRREASKQREDYTLDEPEAAATLSNSPIKYSRSTDAAPREEAAPARKGCMGCMGLVLGLLLLGTATVAWAAL